MAIPGEAVHARIAVAVGDIEIAGRSWHEFAGVVKGPCGVRHQIARLLTAGVGVHAVAPHHLNGLAIQRIHQAYRAIPVGEIDGVVGDVDAVGEEEGAIAPAGEEFPLPIKDGDRRVFALEGVDPVLRSVATALTMAKVSPAGSLAQSWITV